MPPEHENGLPQRKEESSAEVQKSPWGFILKVLAGIIVSGSTAFGIVMKSNDSTQKTTISYERDRAEKAEAALATERDKYDNLQNELLIKNNIITDYRTADSVTQYLRKKTVEPTRKILTDAKH